MKETLWKYSLSRKIDLSSEILQKCLDFVSGILYNFQIISFSEHSLDWHLSLEECFIYCLSCCVKLACPDNFEIFIVIFRCLLNGLMT